MLLRRASRVARRPRFWLSLAIILMASFFDGWLMWVFLLVGVWGFVGLTVGRAVPRLNVLRDVGGPAVLVLHDSGDKPIHVVKVLRDVSDMSLTDAKSRASATPCDVAAGLDPAVAADVCRRLIAAGASASVELR